MKNKQARKLGPPKAGSSLGEKAISGSPARADRLKFFTLDLFLCPPPPPPQNKYALPGTQLKHVIGKEDIYS